MGKRVRVIRKELNMTQEALAKRLGIGKSALSMIETGKAALSERNKNILINELHVNPAWMETGQGEVFMSHLDAEAFRRRMGGNPSLNSVPLYNLDETGGLVQLFSGSTSYKPIDFIHIPGLPKCDGAIYVAGDSMYPLLKGGDIVMYKQVGSTEDIFWGDMYLVSVNIDGDEYITVKYIQRSEKEGHVKLVSQNPMHAEKEIESSKILALALVKASIRMNTLR